MKNQLRKMSSKERPSPVLAGEPDCLWALLNWELARFSWDIRVLFPLRLFLTFSHSPRALEVGRGEADTFPGLDLLKDGAYTTALCRVRQPGYSHISLTPAPRLCTKPWLRHALSSELQWQRRAVNRHRSGRPCHSLLHLEILWRPLMRYYPWV